MIEYSHLWLFFVILLGVVMLPGLDMAYVLGSSLTGGYRRGLVAVAGMVTGGVVHVTAGALGFGALLGLLPGAFSGILLAGAAYIVWMGLSILRNASSFGRPAAVETYSAWTVYRGAVATNMLNPKAYLFMLAIFPQFLRPDYGTLWVQAIVLGVMVTATQAAVYGAVAFVAGGLRGWMLRNPSAGITMNRVVGALLILAAFVTAVDGWQGL